MKRPVIIDTDLTTDDIAAFSAVAESELLDIKAISVAGKNAEYKTKKLSDICKSLGICCTFAAGAVKPVFKAEFSNQDIYGNIAVTETADCCSVPTNYPWDIISTEAEKADGSLEIITLGPVTNIAITLLRYPHIKPLIKHIFIAAGANYTGNAAPYSEYNAYCDPDALQILFDSGVPVILFPLEGAENCNIGGYAAAAMDAFINIDTLKTKEYFAVCETRSGENQGWTVIDRLGKYKKAANISVVTD